MMRAAACILAFMFMACAGDLGQVTGEEDVSDMAGTHDLEVLMSTEFELCPTPEPLDLPLRPDLPDPLVTFCDAEAVADSASWEAARRPEIRALFEHYVYGRAPAPPAGLVWDLWDDAPGALDGRARRLQTRLAMGEVGGPTLHLLVYLPADVAQAPVILGLNFYANHSVTHDPAVPLSMAWLPERAEGVVDHRATEAARGTAADRWPIEEALARGYGVATLYHGDVDPDRDDPSDGVQPQFYAPGQTAPAPGEWGSVAAWAWGLSRALDFLLTDARVDPARVAVMGHSRNGKAALWAGALDERFSLVISNQSGCTGAAISRRQKGETVALITAVFPHWFTSRYAAFAGREDHLPVDQHLLIAMIAPRPVLVKSGVEDLWADPEGELQGVLGSGPVYALYGEAGPDSSGMPPVGTVSGGALSYHIREGAHGVGLEDWRVMLDFADQRWGAP
jgi:hypothetical protein